MLSLRCHNTCCVVRTVCRGPAARDVIYNSLLLHSADDLAEVQVQRMKIPTQCKPVSSETLSSHICNCCSIMRANCFMLTDATARGPGAENLGLYMSSQETPARLHIYLCGISGMITSHQIVVRTGMSDSKFCHTPGRMASTYYTAKQCF